MNLLSIIAFISFMLLWTSVTCFIELSGDHVCHKQENYTETVNTTKTEPMQVRKNFWCIPNIRCSEMQSEKQEVVRVENVTRSRVIKFCCPGFEEFENDGKKICKEIKNETTVFAPKNFTSIDIKVTKLKGAKNVTTTAPDSKNITLETTEKNPYMNYSGEYGKEFNHYMKMGLNESDAQQSVNKLVEMEIKKAKEDYDSDLIEEPDGFIFVDVAGNELEPLKHPQYVTDFSHHFASHHDENIAMVTVGCVIFGMCIFLILMVYILKKQQSLERDIEEIDPNFESKKSKLPPSKIIHEPLPIPPIRPALKKHRSVTFDNSIDEVDEFNRRRTKSLPDAYDVPRKPTSMMDLYAQSVKVTPKDMATFVLSQKSIYHTFPKKNITRKQSIEHIYDEIPTIAEIKAAEEEQNVENNPTQETYLTETSKPAEVTYANEMKQDENIEKTKM